MSQCKPVKATRQMYVETPTIHSVPLSRLMGYPVYLKLENLQNTGSFKERGISNALQQVNI